MSKETKIRTRMQDGQVEVLVLVNHPMETGQRVDKKTKKKIPAHFIQEMKVQHNGKEVARFTMGIGVSENPLIGLRLQKGQNGDKVKVTWVDNKGESGTAETTVDVS